MHYRYLVFRSKLYRNACNVLQEGLKHFLYKTEKVIRHVTERKVDKASCRNDGPCVAESLETILSMIASHSGVSDSAEWDVFICDVHDNIVDASSS